MRQDRDGVWRATVDLPANRQYCFRYLIDGNWQTDYHADGWSENEYGTENSIVDTGTLTEVAAEELTSITLPYGMPLPASVPEEVPMHKAAGVPVNILGAERAALANRPVRQRTAAVQRAA